jgi:hypothetical protein
VPWLLSRTGRVKQNHHRIFAFTGSCVNIPTTPSVKTFAQPTNRPRTYTLGHQKNPEQCRDFATRHQQEDAARLHASVTTAQPRSFPGSAGAANSSLQPPSRGTMVRSSRLASFLRPERAVREAVVRSRGPAQTHRCGNSGLRHRERRHYRTARGRRCDVRQSQGPYQSTTLSSGPRATAASVRGRNDTATRLRIASTTATSFRGRHSRHAVRFRRTACLPARVFHCRRCCFRTQFDCSLPRPLKYRRRSRSTTRACTRRRR